MELKKLFFVTVFLGGISFFNAVYAAPYEPVADPTVCAKECPGGKCEPTQGFVTMYQCIPGNGTVKQGQTCKTQEQCAKGLYCKDTAGDDECEPQLADGAACPNGGNYSVCAYVCSSKTYYQTGEAIVCGTKPKTEGTTPTTTQPGSDGTCNCKKGTVVTPFPLKNLPESFKSFTDEQKQAVCNQSCVKLGFESGIYQAGSVPGTANSSDTIKIENPLEFKTVEEFIGAVLTRARQVIVVLSLVFILIGAVMYVVSAGNPDLTGQAKKAITAALVGLAIGIAAPSFLKEIGGILGWNGANNSDVSGALTLSQIAVRVLNFLLGIFGALAMIMLIIGGIMYLTSAGDEDRIDKGKKIFTYSLIGIVVAMSALVVVKQIAKFFV